MTTDPRDYETEFTTPGDHRVRRRLGLDVDHGEVRRFVVQLEYRLHPAAEVWAVVVRYHHAATGIDERGHDVTEEGLQMDVYRDGKSVDTVSLTDPLPAAEALEYAEDHVAKNLNRFIRRFEQWHGITPKNQ